MKKCPNCGKTYDGRYDNICYGLLCWHARLVEVPVESGPLQDKPRLMKKCPLCDKEMPEHVMECERCGKNFAPTKSTNETSGASHKVVMECPKCRQAYDRTWKVCLKCSVPLEAPKESNPKAPEIKCSKCGGSEFIEYLKHHSGLCGKCYKDVYGTTMSSHAPGRKSHAPGSSDAVWSIARGAKKFYLEDFKICGSCNALNLAIAAKCVKCANSERFDNLKAKLITTGILKDVGGVAVLALGGLAALAIGAIPGLSGLSRGWAGAKIMSKANESAEFGGNDREAFLFRIKQEAVCLLDNLEKGQREKYDSLIKESRQNFRNGDIARAYQNLLDARSLGYGNSVLSGYFIRCLWEMEKYDEAKQELGKISIKELSVSPDSYDAAMKLIIKFNIDDHDSIAFMKEHCNEVMRDTERAAIFYLANYFLDKKHGDYEFGIKILNKYLSAEKNDCSAKCLLARLYHANGQYHIAIKEARPIYDENKSEEITVLLARCFCASDDHGDEAMEFYQLALSKNILSEADRVKIAIMLGRSLSIKKEYSKAIEFYESFFSGGLMPTILKYHLALAYGQADRVDDQIRELQDILKTDFDNADLTKTQVMKVLARAFMSRKLYELAYKQILQLDLDDEALDLLYDMGNKVEKTDKNLARKCYQEIFGKNIRYKDIVKKIDMAERGEL